MFRNVSCLAFSGSAGGGGAGTAVEARLVAGGAVGGGEGREPGAAFAGGGLLEGGTIRRVSCRADGVWPVVAERNMASVATLRRDEAFIA